MSSEDGEVYIIQGEDDEWASPTPASTAIREAVTAGTDLDDGDLEDIETYVDRGELRAVLEASEGSITFEVEGYEVTVAADGEITVAD